MSRLTEIFFSHRGNVSDKWEHYLGIYDAELARFVTRGQPVHLLEIGVQNGGSLQVWSKYLPPGSSVVGIDIDPSCADLSLGENVRVAIADASDPVAIDRVLGDDRFDVIIDDGSHRSEDIVATFEACFDRLLPGGLYVIEDLHCSYFTSHGGGFRRPDAVMEWLKNLTDSLNADHFQNDAAATAAASELHRLRVWGSQIARIAFFDSVTVVEKLAARKLKPYRRVIAGHAAPVSNISTDLVQLSAPELRAIEFSPSVDAFTPTLMQSLAAAREEVGELRAALVRAQRAERDHARTGAQFEALRAAMAHMEGRITKERARTAAAETRARGAEARANAECLRADAAEADARALRSSTAWQVTWPIRSMAQHLPPSGRRLGRRGVRAFWWTITGQLFRRLRAPPAFKPLLAAKVPSSDTLASLPVGVAVPLSKTPGSTDPYQAFQMAHTPGAGALLLQRRMAAGLLVRPRFSVLVPVFSPPADVFKAMLDSVRTQSYEHWELCLAVVDADPNSTEVLDIARKAVACDPRIRLEILSENRGISGNSNVALEMATGEWSVLLDHDDLLSPEALFQVARALNAEPEADFIYSDKDMVDRFGRQRYEPLLKPDWSPEVMLNANYLTHLCAMRTETLRIIGGWDPDTDGAQDWDLFLRFIGKGVRVVHLPHVLYHWRHIESSVAFGGFDVKPYAVAGQLRALAKYLPVVGWSEATPFFHGPYIRIRWGGVPPKVSVVVVGGLPTSRHAAVSHWTATVELLTTDEPNSKAVDAAIARATGDIVTLVDACFEPEEANWLDELVLPLLNPAIALVAGRVFDTQDRILDYGVFLQDGAAYPAFRGEAEHYNGPAGSVGWYRNSAAAAGGALAFRRSLWTELGGFESYSGAGRADLAFTLEVGRRGLGRLMLNPFARFKASDGPCSFEKSAIAPLSQETIRAAFPAGDPYLNPHLDAAVPLGAPVLRLPAMPAPPAPGHDFAAEARHVAIAYDATSADITASVRACAAEPCGPLRRVLWVVPHFEVAFYGGIHTIFRAAEHMRVRHGVAQAFAVFGTPDESNTIAARISQAFPGLAANAEVSTFTQVDLPPDLGYLDAAICTLWITAYPLLKIRRVRRKFYFMQDWEPLFYPAGTISSAVEATYRFGFHAVCNTPSLAQSYRELGGQADFFLPAVDTAVFHTRGRPVRGKADPFVLFWYARPGTPRNCFEALAEGLVELKQRYGTRIEIVSAGAAWEPVRYGLGQVVRNLGLLPYSETGALYRAADAGLVAMATRHPSYLPFELMACGAVVVTNRNPYTRWLLRDGDNSLQCEMARGDITTAVGRLIEDPVLRDSLAARANADIAAQYSDWDISCEKIYHMMRDGVEDLGD
jgi:cellulose synthase/poly-beta-1,6-N-acetylglucosamine synthase-like glycosyltransferase/glycosyltransferase involved in cell wall biosynthesis